MLVDIGDDQWVEAGMVYCVRKTQGNDGTCLTAVEVSGGDIYYTSLPVNDIATRIRTAQREMLAGGRS